MRRFVRNRWWAHILTLALVLGAALGAVTQGNAATRNSVERPDAIGRAYGDPDATGGTNRSPNGYTPTWSLRGTSEGAVGDGVPGATSWVKSLQFAWEIAKTRWLR